MTPPRAFLCLAVFAWYLSSAQNDSLIQSSRVLAEAEVLADSGRWTDAVTLLQRIDSRDTSYVAALSKQADYLLAAGRFDEAIDATEKGLRRPGPLKLEFLLTQGMAYTQAGRYSEAEMVFDAGIAEFPTSSGLVLQKGKLYYNQKQYNKAEQLFLQGLTMSPFNSISHLHLGIIAMLRGEKVRGMMAMGLYIAINNTQNKQLVLLERFVKNELTDEFSIPPSPDNSFTRLDAILRSQIAMDEEYKTVIPINAGIVKQFHLMFNELERQPRNNNDSWLPFYASVYSAILKEKLQDAFVYHLLTSSSIEAVHEWTGRNEQTLNRFYQLVNTTMKEWRQRREFPQLGYAAPVACVYDENSRVESIGNTNTAGNPEGLWYYLFPNGVKKASGHYNSKGDKTGVWKYYNESGYLTDFEDFGSGLRERFNAEGLPWQRYHLRNGVVHGEVFIYHPCGAVREHLFYEDGMRSGSGEVYATNGTAVERFIYERDSLQGEYRSFYESGEQKTESKYQRGNLEGLFKRYHRNGKVAAQGEYRGGLATGQWQFFHDNGQLSEEGQYLDDQPFGEFRYYNRNGMLYEKRGYDSTGEYHGVNEYYHGGRPHYKLDYEKGRLMAASYFDTLQNTIATFHEANGAMEGRGYFPTGELRSEYSYQNGLAAGTWKYFDRTGFLESQYSYDSGRLHGAAVEYYASGAVKLRANYEKGNRHGLFEEFYPDGKVRSRGWFQNDRNQQRWLTYHPNGVIRSDDYFIDGVQAGASYYYAQDGKLFSVDEVHNERLSDYRLYNKDGEVISTFELKNGNGTLEGRHNTGVEYQRVEFSCDKVSGKKITNFPDGKLYQLYNYLDGKLHGEFKRSAVFGEPENIGTYVDGVADGKWTWFYPNGQPETVGIYHADERDSVWTYYFEDGNRSREHTYASGKRQGVSKFFAPNGELLLEKMYDQGNFISYRVSNSAAKTWIPFSGTGTIKVKYANGKTALEEQYKNGVYHGIVKVFFPNGNLFSQARFVYGDQHGDFAQYYANGKLKNKGQYELGNEHGRWEWFDAEGRLQRTQQYAFGLLNGVCELFMQGRKVKSINFWYGLPVSE